MTEARDKTEGGEQSGALHPRAAWQRPALRKLQTDHAELGVTNGAPDGTFTTS
jgi:hypothetical protein